MIKAGIMGATGYVGTELYRLLGNHPHVSVEMITSQSQEGKAYGEVYENYRHDNAVLSGASLSEMAKACDVVFIALPHGVAAGAVTDEMLNDTVVIDMGADFRLTDPNTYQKWYDLTHDNPSLLQKAVYGLCEIHRDKIKGSRLIANPGCYTTCSILALYPLLKEGIISPKGIVIDAKSGVSGAGRGVNQSVHFCETDENFKAYKVASHRHTPEIEQELSQATDSAVVLSFTPHLVPMNRGILATSYADLINGANIDSVKAAYQKHYGNEPFIRTLKPGQSPETRWVKATNFVDIGFAIDERTDRIIVMSALDNLMKGAAGQAIQNMNIIFDWDEKTGLWGASPFPV